MNHTKPPWEKPAPKKSKHKKLTPAQKQLAKRTAMAAGRPYPNLIDNMKASQSGTKKKSK